MPYDPYISAAEHRSLLAEIERLRAGVKEIDRFLTENRPGDAHFVCDALLAEVDEQTTTEKTP